MYDVRNYLNLKKQSRNTNGNARQIKHKKCDKCDATFSIYIELFNHRETIHRTVLCDMCDTEVSFKNIRRHIKTI